MRLGSGEIEWPYGETWTREGIAYQADAPRLPCFRSSSRPA